MPHYVDVKCTHCRNLAHFEFAEIVKINLKEDVPFFQDSSLFEYYLFSDHCGHKWHGAIYFAGLHGGSVDAITELPDGYKPEYWKHSQYLMRNHGLDLGSIRCVSCNTNKMHTLDWPNEAFFSIGYKGKQLWAFDRESAIDLRDFITSTGRNIDNYKWRNFLLYVPSIFTSKKARESVTKLLDRLLT